MELRAHHARVKLRLLSLIGFVFAGGGIWMISTEPVWSENWWAGLGGVGLFVPALLILLQRSCDPRPALLVTAAGLHDSRTMDDLVPWSAIASIREKFVYGQHVLTLDLSQPDSTFVRSPMKRLVNLLNRPFGFGDVYINLFGLDVASQDVRIAIERYKAIQG